MNEDRKAVAEWCAKNVLPGDTFIDVGADIGEMSEVVLALGHAKRIIAIDPEAEFLREKFKGTQVEVIDTLIADQEGEMTLHRNPENTALNSIYRRRDLKDTVQVVKPVTTMDALVEKYGLEAPIVLKIDAEFAEYVIWKGLQRSLPKIKIICMEYQKEAMDREGFDGDMLITRIRRAGCNFRYINANNIEVYHQ